MTTEQVWLAAACALTTVVALAALLVAARAQGRATRAESLAASLAERVAVLESPVAQSPAPADQATFVITHLDEPGPVEREVPVAREIDGRLFADIQPRRGDRPYRDPGPAPWHRVRLAPARRLAHRQRTACLPARRAA